MKGGEWVPPRPVSFTIGPFSTSMISRMMSPAQRLDSELRSLRMSKHEIRTSFVPDHSNQDFWHGMQNIKDIRVYHADIQMIHTIWLICTYWDIQNALYVLLCGSISNYIQLVHKYVQYTTDPHLVSILACSHCIHRPQSSSACFSASAMAASSFWKVIPMASETRKLSRHCRKTAAFFKR